MLRESVAPNSLLHMLQMRLHFPIHCWPLTLNQWPCSEHKNWRYVPYLPSVRPMKRLNFIKHSQKMSHEKLGFSMIFQLGARESFRRRAQQGQRSCTVAGDAMHHREFICKQRLRMRMVEVKQSS